VLRGKIMRVVPRENEALNETWIADRDRFGFEGMYSPERATQPMVRIDGVLQPVEWEFALAAAADGLQRAVAAQGAQATGFLVSPMATLEEMYLAARLAEGLGTRNIDHRLRQLDFRAPEAEGAYPTLGLNLADVETLGGLLVVGSNLRHEMPLLAHRVRKAAVKGGARVAFLNPRRFEYQFPVAAYGLAEHDLVGELVAVVHAAALAAGRPVPAGVPAVEVREAHRSLASVLAAGSRRAVFLGTLAQRHPAYAELKRLAGLLAELSGATLGLITEGPNAAGAYLAGAVPHRQPGGVARAVPGLSARAMLESRLAAYVLVGGIDPVNDLYAGADALGAAPLVVAAATHLTPSLRELAHVILPIGVFAEGAGTFVNVEGRWQSWTGAARLPGESRPGWKVLRVLANLLEVHGVDYVSSEEVRDALRQVCGGALLRPGGAAAGGAKAVPGSVGGPVPPGSWVDIPPYQGDVLVRGSDALSKTRDGRLARDVI
jgi:NADH-quinone oxidoreductase subunit G